MYEYVSEKKKLAAAADELQVEIIQAEKEKTLEKIFRADE